MSAETPHLPWYIFPDKFPSKFNMDTSEKLCLKWNDFQENISSYFGDLRSSKDFTDVTLACEDGQRFETHKIILASSSPVFVEILTGENNSQPLIFMRSVKSEDLSAILDFLYFGEAEVLKDKLESFLAIAEDLKIKGLCGTVPHNEQSDLNAKMESVEIPKKKKRKLRKNSKPPSASSKTKFKVDPGELDEQIKSMMTKSSVSFGNRQGSLATCNICGKQSPAKSMPRHIEANHITGVTHACDICGKVSTSRNALKKHKSENHRDGNVILGSDIV